MTLWAPLVVVGLLVLAGSRRRYPRLVDVPAHTNGYNTASRRAPIDQVVIHSAEGQRPWVWFQDSRASVATHYSVDAAGTVYRSVPENHVAWHAGSLDVNNRSIGIELTGFADQGAWTQAQLRAAAQLVGAIAGRYRFAVTSTSVRGHGSVPGQSHTDPGPLFPWSAFLRAAA